MTLTDMIRAPFSSVASLARSLTAVLLVAGVAVMAAGCAGSPTASTGYASFSQTDLVTGTGVVATSGQTLSVNYIGWIYDASQPLGHGGQFDTSFGKTPFSFVLGAGSVIKGWDQGVPGMRVGGTRQLIVPPSLAYGGTRSGTIPPNATLIFEITLLDAQ